MAVRDIVIWPDPRLKEKTRLVEVFDDGLKELLDDMVDSMYAAEGIGLAGPQVGEALRIFVVDPEPDDPDSYPIAFVNPEIVEIEGETIFEEGCLSVPGEIVEIKRGTRVKMRAQDEDGEPFEVEAEGLLAIALQHEFDHLEGALIVDRLSSIKRDLLKKKIQAIKEEQG